MRREQIEAEISELKAENDSAPGWGAAVGARCERIKGLERQLDAMTVQPSSTGKIWCPGCSGYVEEVCHHFNCAIGPNGLAAQVARSSAGTTGLPGVAQLLLEAARFAERELGKKEWARSARNAIHREFVAAINAPAQAAREPGEAHPALKQADELHDLGFKAGWNGAIEECARIADERAKYVSTDNARSACEGMAAAVRALAAQPPAAPVEEREPLVCSKCEEVMAAAVGLPVSDARSSAGTDDALLLKLADMIDRGQCGDVWDINDVSEEDHARLPALLRQRAQPQEARKP